MKEEQQKDQSKPQSTTTQMVGLKKEFVAALGDYLARRPYNEVKALMQILEGAPLLDVTTTPLPPVKPEDVQPTV